MNRIIVGVMVVCVAMSVVSLGYAETRFEQCSHKLGRGLTNVVTGPLELGHAVDMRISESGIYKGICFGTIEGVTKAVTRMGAGVYEVISFPIEKPADFRPIVEPEFVFVQHDNTK